MLVLIHFIFYISMNFLLILESVIVCYFILTTKSAQLFILYGEKMLKIHISYKNYMIHQDHNIMLFLNWHIMQKETEMAYIVYCHNAQKMLEIP